jgi:signal transduction histidine kinase
MNLAFNFSPTFRRSLRSIEWLLVVAFLLVYGLDPQFNDSPIEALVTIACGFSFVGLSWALPTHRPVWQRQIYLLSGVLLSLLVRSMGLDWDLFLYFYIAKSCFLLERRNLTITIIGITLLNISLFYWARSNSQYVWQWLFQYIVTYTAVLAFVVYLSLVVITEQKSRHRAEALAQQVETLAATLERTRIARDIHDSLGHLLTDLNARLAVAQALRDRDPEEASQAVDMAKLLASESIAEVKRSLQIIRRSDFDLNEALTTLMEQLRHNQSLSVQWELNLPPLPLSTSHHLYCIVKEGLINIQKHSRASAIHLRSQFSDRELWLDLEDNGQGFDPAFSHDGFGLKGMAERVQLLSGTLTIHSTLGSGTQIRVTLPL